MFLSQDYCATLDWFPAAVGRQMVEAGLAKGWSMTLIFDEVIPALRERGMTDDQLETMMVSNPVAWLTGKRPS
jgi:phosphotriesterase-related protein